MNLKDATEQDLEIWLSARFQAEYLAIAKMKEALDANAQLIAKNSKENEELLALLHNFKGFFTIMSMVATFAVWVAKITVMLTVIWALWKFAILEAFKELSAFKGDKK